MPKIEEVEDLLWRVELDKPAGLPEPADLPNSVYLLGGDSPALINVGHPAQFEELTSALRRLEYPAPDIERVVYTSWHIDSLGGATNFPQADHFVFSPDMVAPRSYEEYLEGYRAELRGLADEVLERLENEKWSYSEVDEFLRTALPPATNRLSHIPVRNGHIVAAGPLELEVLAAPGPNPGHCILFDSERGHLFSGDLALGGLPTHIDDVESYMTSIERAVELDARFLLPSYGRVSDRPTFQLQHSLSFCDNFLSNAPMALAPSPTIIEFLERDRGYLPDSLVEYVLLLRSYRAFLDELEASGAIETEGKGLDKRYGIHVESSRMAVL